MGLFKGFMGDLKKQLSGVQLKYLGGHPDADFIGNVSVIREGDCITFFSFNRPNKKEAAALLAKQLQALL